MTPSDKFKFPANYFQEANWVLDVSVLYSANRQKYNSMPQRNFLLTIVLFAASLASLSAQVQVPALCPGDPKPSNSCQDACVSCQFFHYTGINDTFYPSPAPGFCGTVSNNMWFGFVAGAAQGEFVLEATNCYVGDGMQLALYDDCELPQLPVLPASRAGPHRC